VGYEKHLNSDLRVRLTVSGYRNSGEQANFLYNGDRASSCYYNVMETEEQGADWSGRLRFTVPEVSPFWLILCFPHKIKIPQSIPPPC
jgi:hypothetical protein